ncbi:hypothetical protein COW36_10270 [bacterium (Candidatus Blackallbacteria) CG17_big_fil_post_rev_8_21_14_2_50_48_46]|uniref:Uncharacterized protein n=1 Tax=bacterium (Candidatus Blackallbacteria) CG17_big_fil_post_rev_8_21_14_2_50_48_46 TaxID=2014261 RepID=A0A2M7G553_9BACT|nr:MAG: hypothetical protein COW64_20040 [bacterium (Candidatus Blackallbacteria) CG18_big_fil_WC_8_21_14_2_50_49_26]PIW17018.1 MAG: hypothetical protein COW36_10270 [bacterium (Candidatus Blackallbacteria) CG17_big_fil_post_rev_8_21_14_2_50_48_46]PIW48174.1 MAG: hypothetical protein COW20_10405 [bacterium (Candidatus Blackallbacteria) CG13_big_fil_rev_8_21_14_2_50_49_14]
MKRILVALSLCLVAGLPACTERQLPGAIGTNQQSAQTASLKIVFLFQDPQSTSETPGAFLSTLHTLRFEIRQNNSSLKSDELSLSDSDKQAAELSRKLEKIPVGQIELKLSFLDKEGKELQPTLVQTLKTLSNAESSLKIALYGTAPQVLETVDPSPVVALSSLWKEQLSLQTELQGLYQQQSTLLLQARTLLKSQAPEDRIQLEQVRNELNTLTQQIEPKETRISAIESELKGLEAQSTAKDMVQLLLLLQQATTLRKDIDILLQRRATLFSQSKVYLGQGNSAQELLSQAQTELQTVNDSLNVKQRELETVVANLEKLQVQVVASSASSLSKEQLQSELELLAPAIQQLETHEQELKQQIAGLIEKTDLRNTQRREGYEAELKELQARLADLRSQRDALQKRLDALK